MRARLRAGTSLFALPTCPANNLLKSNHCADQFGEFTVLPVSSAPFAETAPEKVSPEAEPVPLAALALAAAVLRIARQVRRRHCEGG